MSLTCLHSLIQTTKRVRDVIETPSTLSTGPKVQGLSQRVIIVLIATLPIVVACAMVAGVLYCYRVRAQRTIQKQHKADIENCLRRALPPTLALDTDIPRAHESQRSASALDLQLHRSRSASTSQLFALYNGYITEDKRSWRPENRSAPPSVYAPSVYIREPSPVSANRSLLGLSRSATRNPLGSHPPGVGGRVASQVSFWEEM